MTRDASAQTPTGRGLLAAGRALLERQMRLVRRLADKGAEIAKGLAQAATAAPASRLERLSARFQRVSRVIWIATILETRLALELAAPAGATADRLEPKDPPFQERPQHEDRHAAKAAREDHEASERLGRELSDEAVVARLWRYVMTSPIDKLIARIRRDLGLSADWMREAEEDAEGRTSSSPVSTGEVSPQATEGASHAHGPRPPPVLRTTSPARGGGWGERPPDDG